MTDSLVLASQEHLPVESASLSVPPSVVLKVQVTADWKGQWREHSMADSKERSLANPTDFSKVHSMANPTDLSKGHLMEHSMANPTDLSKGHSMEHSMEHSMAYQKALQMVHLTVDWMAYQKESLWVTR